MNTLIRFNRKAIDLAAVLVLASAVGTAEADGGGAPDQVIVISADTTSVSVYRGETVRFINEQSGQSFSWSFDTAMPAVDLNQVAPGGALGGQHVTAHVLD